MAYAQINGYNVIPMPSYPAPKEITLYMSDTVGESRSEFTSQRQTMYWQGGDFWRAKVSMPVMTVAEFQPWKAWFASMRGKANVFAMGDPMQVTPQGSVVSDGHGTPVFKGQQIAGSYYVNIQNLLPNAPAVWLPGDYITVASSLIMIAGSAPIAADSSGNASNVEIWPSLRLAFNDGDGIGISGCTGLWQLDSNEREFSISTEKLYTLAFGAIESR